MTELFTEIQKSIPYAIEDSFTEFSLFIRESELLQLQIQNLHLLFYPIFEVLASTTTNFHHDEVDNDAIEELTLVGKRLMHDCFAEVVADQRLRERRQD